MKNELAQEEHAILWPIVSNMPIQSAFAMIEEYASRNDSTLEVIEVWKDMGIF